MPKIKFNFDSPASINLTIGTWLESETPLQEKGVNSRVLQALINKVELFAKQPFSPQERISLEVGLTQLADRVDQQFPTEEGSSLKQRLQDLADTISAPSVAMLSQRLLSWTSTEKKLQESGVTEASLLEWIESFKKIDPDDLAFQRGIISRQACILSTRIRHEMGKPCESIAITFLELACTLDPDGVQRSYAGYSSSFEGHGYVPEHYNHAVNLTDDQIIYICSANPSLTELVINSKNITDKIGPYLAKLTKLEKLRINGSRLTQLDLRNCTELKDLCIECDTLQDLAVGCPKLQKVRIFSRALKAFTLPNSCKDIQSVYLHGNMSRVVLPQAAESLESFAYGGAIEQLTLPLLAKNLKFFECSNFPSCGTSTMTELRLPINAQQIQSCDISGSAIKTIVWPVVVPNLDELETFKGNGTQLEDLSALKNAPKLTLLELVGNTNLRGLDVSANTNIRWVDVTHCTNLASLKLPPKPAGSHPVRVNRVRCFGSPLLTSDTIAPFEPNKSIIDFDREFILHR